MKGCWKLWKEKRRRQHTKKQKPVFYTKLVPSPEDGILLEDLRRRMEAKKSELKLNNRQIDVLLREADANGDHRITFDEFEQYITSRSIQSSQTKRMMCLLADQVTTPSQRVEVHSYIDEYRLCPPPLFILTITLIQIAVFFFYYCEDSGTKTNADVWTDCAGCFAFRTGHFPLCPEASRTGLALPQLHVLAFGLIIGIPLEIVHKSWRIGPIYLLAVVAGSLLQYSMDPRVFLVGASAGVYALLTAHLANIFLNWSEMPYRWVRITVVGLFLLLDFGGAIYRRFGADECDEVSHSAHIAGAITGFCFGVFVLYNIVDHLWERIVRYISLAIYVIFVLLCIGLTIYQQPNSKPLWQSPKCSSV
ncbi:hypothetical protein WR25_01590 [Diploscapter pachys]|uniref:EF-hand domain-containing protein n=1 Tax=Diploscapter pachys TaxID=2018661 RepID=A0A2A2KPY1_9BILA|nr:hypothetical protein WR25_01590 [Diploscapter pachys]